MAPIIFAWPGTVHFLVVLSHQRFPALWIVPYPFLESILNDLLFLLGEGSLFDVQNAAFFAICILDSIINAVLASGEKRHKASGENNHFASDENRHSPSDENNQSQ